MENKGINSLLARAFTSNDALRALVDTNNRVIDSELVGNPNLTEEQRSLIKGRYNLPGTEPLVMDQLRSRMERAVNGSNPDKKPKIESGDLPLQIPMSAFYQALLYGSFLSPEVVKQKYVAPIEKIADLYGYDFYRIFFQMVEGWEGSITELIEVTLSIMGSKTNS